MLIYLSFIIPLGYILMYSSLIVLLYVYKDTQSVSTCRSWKWRENYTQGLHVPHKKIQKTIKHKTLYYSTLPPLALKTRGGKLKFIAISRRE